MAKMNTLDMVANLLVIIGGINWLLVGAIQTDLVQLIFGSVPILAQAIYIIIGLSALYMLYKMFAK
jgi:uncharacterized membrane protein YuzA (DUF378 family)